jgi:hypothetical protein
MLVVPKPRLRNERKLVNRYHLQAIGYELATLGSNLPPDREPDFAQPLR